MTRVFLARHGESDWNVENRFQGHTDRPLTERGREQARALARELAAESLQAIYTSPLRRARETADVVGTALGIDPVADPDLVEIDVGGWAGLSRAEAEERHPQAFRRWVEGGEGWEDGETFERMAARVVGALRRIAAAHPEGSVLVVSHGGPIRAVLASALGMEVREHRRAHRVEPNARLSVVTVEDGRITGID